MPSYCAVVGCSNRVDCDKELSSTQLNYKRICAKHLKSGKLQGNLDDPDWIPFKYLGYDNKIITNNNLSAMCCICFQNNNELQSIYDKDQNDINFQDKLKFFESEIDMFTWDLPLSICTTCANNLQIAYEFKKQLLRNRNQLRSYISKSIDNKSDDYSLNTPLKLEKVVIEVVKSNPKLKEHKCETCSKAFSQIGNLITHKRTHTNEKPYLCDVCSRSFARSDELTVHKRIHNDVKPFSCTECTKTFRQRSTLNNHKRVHSKEKPFPCDICRYKCFSTLQNLKTHKLINHCSESERDFVCEFCSKSFAHLSILKTHKLVHTGERKFSCNVCRNSFTQAQHLKRHMQTHTKIRPFICDVCDCSYTQMHHLNRHKQKHKTTNK